MNVNLILLIGACAFLICVMGYFLFINPPKKKNFRLSGKKSASEEYLEKHDTPENDNSFFTDRLRNLADKCEKGLAPEQRGLIKILIEKEHPELAAALQIEELKLSIKRDHKNKSMFDTHNIIYALNLARCGYTRSARVIPTRSEIEFLLAHREIINPYLKELGLEQISETDEFWFLDVPSKWTFSWPNYKWDLTVAYDNLHDKFRVLTPDGIRKEPSKLDAKLILLLNGWEDLFEEI